MPPSSVGRTITGMVNPMYRNSKDEEPTYAAFDEETDPYLDVGGN